MVWLMAMSALAFVAHASVTNIAYWRMGDNDPGAVNGALATSTTNLMGGKMALISNAAYTNAVPAAAMGSTLALNFASGKYGTNALVTLPTNNFGMELWVRPAVSNVTQCLIYNGNSSSSGCGLYIVNGQYQALFGGLTFLPSGIPAVTNAWVHLALVRNNGTNFLYVNGAPVATNTVAPVAAVGWLALAVQPQTLTAEFYSGALDEVRLFGFAAGSFSATDLLIDQSPPIFSGCPGNISVTTPVGSGTAVATWTAPTASDNVGVTSVTATATSGTSFFVGTNVVTYTARDAAGNLNTCSFTVTVLDGSPPVFSGCPANVMVSSGQSSTAIATWTPPTATDNVGVTSVTNNYAPGASFPVGTTLVTYLARDAAGNSNTCSFNVTVVDTGVPILSGCPGNITVFTGPSASSAVATWTAPTASDNVAVTNLTSSAAPGSTFPVGTNTVVYTARDAAGNSNTCSFKVTVIDNGPPIFSGCPGNISVTTSVGSGTAVATWTAPTASDNVGVTSVTATATSGTSFFVGTNVVTYTARDAAGNLNTCSFTVTVLDGSPPVFSSCPTNMVVLIPGNLTNGVATWVPPTASDNIGVTSVTNNYAPGASFPVGTTLVTYLARDAAGNSNTCSFSISVSNTLPAITLINPTRGPTAGGAVITLTGLNFGSVAGSVSVNGNAGTVTAWANDTILFSLPAGQGANLPLIVTKPNSARATNTFSYDVPIITSVSPTLAGTAGGATITLVGTNFGTSGQLTHGGRVVPTVSWQHSQILGIQPAGQGANLPLVVTVTGQTNPAFAYSYTPPSLSGISPANGPTAGGTVITLTGLNLGTNGTIDFDGATLGGTLWTNTQVLFNLPPGQGLGKTVNVTVSGQTSAALGFNYNPPVLTDMSPANGPTAGGTTITLTGSNFGLSGTISFDGVNVPSTAWSHTNVQFTLPPGQGRGLVVNLAVGGLTSSSLLFNYDAPLLLSLSPTSAPTAGGTTITLIGTSLGTTGAVTFAGNLVTNTYWSHTNVQFILPRGQGAGLPVTLSAGGQSANTTFFKYSSPTVLNVTPANGPTLGNTIITLTGDSFGTNGVLTIGERTATSSSWSHSQIIALTPPGEGTNRVVRLTVSGQTNSPAYFNYDPPIISSVTPAAGSTAGGTSITLIGQNFGESGTVFVGSASANLLAWSQTNIQFTLPVGQGAGVPVIVTVAGQINPTKTFNYSPPSIATLSPVHGPTVGGTVITVTGTNFGTSGLLTVGARSALTQTWTHGLVIATLPAGEGIDQPVTVSVSGQTNQPVFFSYDDPLLQSIFPAGGPTAGGTVITLIGTNFGLSGTATINGSPILLSSWTHGQIIGRTPSGTGENVAVLVHNAGRVSNPNLFSYTRPPLAIAATPGGLMIAWPTNASDYVLEQCSRLDGDWTTLSPPLVLNGTNWNFTPVPSSTNSFFRLRRP